MIKRFKSKVIISPLLGHFLTQEIYCLKFLSLLIARRASAAVRRLVSI